MKKASILLVLATFLAALMAPKAASAQGTYTTYSYSVGGVTNVRVHVVSQEPDTEGDWNNLMSTLEDVQGWNSTSTVAYPTRAESYAMYGAFLLRGQPDARVSPSPTLVSAINSIGADYTGFCIGDQRIVPDEIHSGYPPPVGTSPDVRTINTEFKTDDYDLAKVDTKNWGRACVAPTDCEKRASREFGTIGGHVGTDGIRSWSDSQSIVVAAGGTADVDCIRHNFNSDEECRVRLELEDSSGNPLPNDVLTHAFGFHEMYDHEANGSGMYHTMFVANVDFPRLNPYGPGPTCDSDQQSWPGRWIGNLNRFFYGCTYQGTTSVECTIHGIYPAQAPGIRVGYTIDDGLQPYLNNPTMTIPGTPSSTTCGMGDGFIALPVDFVAAWGGTGILNTTVLGALAQAAFSDYNDMIGFPAFTGNEAYNRDVWKGRERYLASIGSSAAVAAPAPLVDCVVMNDF